MRNEIFRLERVEDREQVRRPFRLPCLCQYCAHALFPEASTMEPGKVHCSQGLKLPTYGGFCHGFTRAQKTVGNKETQKATNGLPSCEACGIVRAPRNNTRLHKGLSGSPRFGRTLVTAFAVYACRFCGQVLTHIGQICNVRGPARARRSRVDRGALQICPFLFPEQHEVFNV